MQLGIRDSIDEIFDHLRATPALFYGTDSAQLLAVYIQGVMAVQDEDVSVDNKAKLYDFGRWLAYKYQRPSDWPWWRTVMREADWLGLSETELTWKLWDECTAIVDVGL